MDHDSYWSLLMFDTNYCDLIERCFSDAKSTEAVGSKPCVETDTAAGRHRQAEHFRLVFEAMEREFRDEFISTCHSLPATTHDDSHGARTSQVFHDAVSFPSPGMLNFEHNVRFTGLAQGWNCLGVEPPPQFMSADAHFRVKIGLKFQSLCKISNISTSDPPVLLGQFLHWPSVL